MTTVTDIIQAGQEVIRDPKHWTKGECAKDAHGNFAGPSDPAAVSWCAVGALSKVTEDKPGQMLETALRELDRASGLIQKKGDFRPAAKLNDEGTHADVMAMFDRAIAARTTDIAA